jgi:hypothetical protein
LNVYNLLGQKIRTLIQKQQSAGMHQVSFDASGLAGGIYFYSIKADGFTAIKKMVYLKSLEEDYYQYEKSKHLYYENGDGDDPFTEPVLIYSNVENGLGVFGGFSSDTTSFNYFIDYQY